MRPLEHWAGACPRHTSRGHWATACWRQLPHGPAGWPWDLLMQRFQAEPAVSMSTARSPLPLAAEPASPGSAVPRAPPCLPPPAFGAFNLPERRPDWPVSYVGEMEPEPGHDGEEGVGCPLPSSSVPPYPTPPVPALLQASVSPFVQWEMDKCRGRQPNAWRGRAD